MLQEWFIIFHRTSGVYILDPPPKKKEEKIKKNMAKSHVGEKKILKGDEKGGKIHIFPPIGQKYAYFIPN